MPFDDTTRKETLTEMGITPIPADVVTRHKRKIEAPHRRKLHGWAYQWQTVSIPATALRSNLIRLPVPVMDGKDLSGAPEKIIKLAETIAERVENPEFQVHYYADDPILTVDYGPNFNRQRATLAIWLKRNGLGRLIGDSKVIAIAEQ